MRHFILAVILCGLSSNSFGQSVAYDTIITIRVLDRMIYDTTIIARNVPAQQDFEIDDSEISDTTPGPIPNEIIIVDDKPTPPNDVVPDVPEVPEEIPTLEIEKEITEVPLPLDSESEIEIAHANSDITNEVIEAPDEIIEEVKEEVSEKAPEEVMELEEDEPEEVVETIEEVIETPEESVDVTDIPSIDVPEIPEESSTSDGSNWTPVVDISSKMAESILSKELRVHVSVLASDEFEGRETGMPGQKMAAKYLVEQFEKIGLEPLNADGNFLQTVPLVTEEWEDVGMAVNGQEYEYMKDFYCFAKSNRSRALTERDEVIFLGFGIDDERYSDYDKVNVQDKVILIYQGEPMDKDSVSYITGTRELSEWALNWMQKLRVARNKGVKAVLFIERNVPFYVARYAYRLTAPYLRLTDKDPASEFANSFYISTDLAKEIIGTKFNKVVRARDKIRDTGKPQFVDLATKIVLKQKELKKEVNGDNVVGMVRGSDPDLQNEHIIISAHYDHLGKKGEEIFNGADDNASGTSAILEIAEAFAKAKKEGVGPKRSIMIMAVSGEEKGLLGSEHYADNPLLSLNDAVANLNIDMIGRYDEAHPEDYDYIYVIGADRLSSDLHKINERMNQNYQNLKLDYTFNAEDDPNRFYYRSDHYNFAEKGVPAAFFFSGVHDDYHRPTDTMEKLNYTRMQRVARLVFHTAWDLANRTDRIQIDVQPVNQK